MDSNIFVWNFLRIYLLLNSIGLISIGRSQEENSTDTDLDDTAFLSNYEEASYKTACDALSLSDPAQLVLDLTRPMSYQDVVKLAYLHKGNPLSNEKPMPFPEDIQWKRDLVDAMYDIFMFACPNEYVNHKYMRIMRELIMIYLNSVEPRATSNADVWQAIQSSLNDCRAKKLPPYQFTTAGLLIQNLMTVDTPETSGRAEEQEVELDSDEVTVGRRDGGADEGSDQDSSPVVLQDNIVPQKEAAQTVFKELDVIIDNFWMVFSHAWGRCIPLAPSKELWGPRFKQIFFRDFLAPLELRWTQLGQSTNEFIDIIVGDIDVVRNQFNIPFCLESAYFRNGITLLQLVRPVKLSSPFESIGKSQNRKVAK